MINKYLIAYIKLLVPCNIKYSNLFLKGKRINFLGWEKIHRLGNFVLKEDIAKIL